MDTPSNIPTNTLLLNQPPLNILQPNDVNKILFDNLIQPPQYLNFINSPSPQIQNIPNFITDHQTQLNTQINNFPENSQIEKPKENNDEKSQKHVKRRSKTDIEGRTFECKLCSKSYLSYPALYTHYKQKHNTNNSSGRGRGRPKKEENEVQIKTKYNPLSSEFFTRSDRTGITNINEINDCVKNAFKILYENKENIKKENETNGIKNYNNVEEHDFLGKFLKNNHDFKRELKETEITDEVLIDYLNKMSKFCNAKYYTILIVFVTLFRENVNKINADKVDKKEFENKKYTEIMNAEDVPDLSNEFITEFLFPEGNEKDFGFTKEEAIDLTLNLCHWMYENNFTCSKLSLTHQ